MILKSDVLIVVVVVLSLAGFGLIQTWRLDKERLKHSEYMEQVQAETLKARAKETELSNQVIEAQNEARKREQTLKAAANSARSAANSLRQQITEYQSNGTATNASPEHAATLAVLLGDCARRYTELGEKADGHASDIKTLIDAWPK